MTRIGLTGGIATGKSTALHLLEEAGAASIEADQLAHATLEPDTPTWQQVVETFGAGILNADRTVNRSRLGEIVFADEGKRQALNGIIHPRVREMWLERLRELEAAGQADTVVSIPLLYEVGAEKQFDCVVAVGCNEQTQLARLSAMGVSEPSARARINAQWPVQSKIDRADFVIWNDGSLDVLRRQVAIIWATIKESYHAPNKN